MLEIPEEHREEIASWQDVPLSVEDVTEEVCAVCQIKRDQHRVNCRSKLGWMGLGKYCYASYFNFQKH